MPGALKTFEALEAVEALEALEATEKALLPMTHLRDNALQSDVISGLRHNSLRGYKGRLAQVSPPWENLPHRSTFLSRPCWRPSRDSGDYSG